MLSTVDRHLDFLGAVERHDIVDMHVLTSYQDKMRSFEKELQGLNKDTLSLEDIGQQV